MNPGQPETCFWNAPLNLYIVLTHWGRYKMTVILKTTLTNASFWMTVFNPQPLTHWGRVTHICVGELAIIGSDNGLSPGRHQAIIWINAGILLIGPVGTNVSDILIGIHTFSFKKVHLKISSAKWRPLCLGLNVFKGSGVLSSPERAGGRQGRQAPLTLWRP